LLTIQRRPRGESFTQHAENLRGIVADMRGAGIMSVRRLAEADNSLGNRTGSRLLKQSILEMFREVDVFSEIWKMLKATVLAFVDDEALSGGLQSPSTL
jgi:hypothetical protein